MSSKVEQKRAFLKLVLLNSTITDKKVRISLKKPFDLLKKSNGCTSWLCSVCNSRTIDYNDIIEIGQEINQAKDKLGLPNLH